MQIRQYTSQDLPSMISIWNEVVEEGVAFPQEEKLDLVSGRLFFETQSYCAVSIDECSNVVGLYILHPNNVGRCSQLANSSYAVSSTRRGQGIGKALVLDSLKVAKDLGFLILQFNAVVATNEHARRLYERLGFRSLGIIPKGFRLKNGLYEDICLYYYEL